VLFALAVVASVLGSVVYAFARKALVSLTSAIACIVVFLLLFIPFREASPEILQVVLFNFPGGGPAPPWTFITTMYVHFDLRHLLFNLLGFILLTPLFEERVGTARFAILYFVTGALASLGFFLVHLDDAFLVYGASGALSGVFGAFARLYPRERVSLWLVLLPIPALPVLVLAVGYVGVSALLGAAGFLGGIAWEAHVIGLLAGFLLARPVQALDLPGRTPASLDLSSLEPLATTPELRGILESLRRETIPEVRDAWLERFAARAVCPECRQPLTCRGRTLRSACGWRLRL
jgi:membrane associated rhomboid family serine protease